MPYSLANFNLSLAAALAAAAGMAMGSELWANQAPEADAAAVYSVLRVYGGPVPEGLLRVPAASVQAMTTAKSAAAALDAANRLYDALYDAENLPRHHWVIAGILIGGDGAIAADPDNDWEVRLVIPGAPPGQIGVDARGFAQVVFNFDIRFQPKEI